MPESLNSKIEQELKQQISEDLAPLWTPLKNYGDVIEALIAIAESRKFQVSQWNEVGAEPDAGGRPPEEWLALLVYYQQKLNQVYAESKGRTPEGRARFAKYAAIQANLALWLVQSLIGQVNTDKMKALLADQAADNSGQPLSDASRG